MLTLAPGQVAFWRETPGKTRSPQALPTSEPLYLEDYVFLLGLEGRMEPVNINTG